MKESVFHRPGYDFSISLLKILHENHFRMITGVLCAIPVQISEFTRWAWTHHEVPVSAHMLYRMQISELTKGTRMHPDSSQKRWAVMWDLLVKRTCIWLKTLQHKHCFYSLINRSSFPSVKLNSAHFTSKAQKLRGHNPASLWETYC